MFKKKSIIFRSNNCLNIKKPYPKECRACIEECPHQAISEKKSITLDRCTECGVCMSVCPSDGFIDIDMDNLGEYILDSDQIILNCPLAEPEGYEISCLGMLDRDAWTTLMIVAMNKDVKILTGDCGACDDRQACAVSVGFFKEIYGAWPEHPRIEIDVVPSKEDKQSANTNVKNLRGTAKKRISLREQGRKKVKELFPDIMAEESYPIPKTREWIVAALTTNQELKIPYKTIKVNEDCTGCGVCSKICPQNALQQIENDGKIILIYEPLKCVQCARCVDICGPDAMKMEYIDLSSKYIAGKILLCETTARYCDKCSKQIFHHLEPRLCMACAAKDPSLKGILY